MNREMVSTRIRDLLDTLDEQLDILMEYRGTIPLIEFDLVMENIRALYEELNILRKMNDAYENAVNKDPAPEPVFRQTGKPRSAPKKESPAPGKPAKEPENDLFAGEEPEFSIRLQEAREQSLGPRPGTTEHLKALININDKFIFINELFDGNLRDYNETVETLNGFGSRKDAFEFIDLTCRKNLWDPSSMAFRKLREVLEKRFA